MLEHAAARPAHRLFPDSARGSTPRSWPTVLPGAGERARSRLLDVATPGPGRYLDPLKIVLPHTDVFVPNTDEAELILGESDPVAAGARVSRDGRAAGRDHPRRTRRRFGFGQRFASSWARYPIYFVDGSGGGDAFNAGYIVGLLEGRSELDCLKLASAVAQAAFAPSAPRPASSPAPGRRIRRPPSAQVETIG